MASTAAMHGCQSTTKARQKKRCACSTVLKRTMQKNLPKNAQARAMSRYLLVDAWAIGHAMHARTLGNQNWLHGVLLLLLALWRQTSALLAHHHQSTMWACPGCIVMLEYAWLLSMPQCMHAQRCNACTYCTPALQPLKTGSWLNCLVSLPLHHCP